MRVSTKLFATAAAFAASVALASASAHAATIVPISSGPFDAGNASGVVPAGTVSNGVGTYDFTFTTDTASYRVLMQLQTSKESNGAPEALAFELFSGTPGTGTALAASGGTPTAATLTELLAPGNYYMEMTSAAPKSLITGGITLLTAIPEPATWAMMITGLGLLGLAGRRRRTLSAAAV